MDNDEYTVSFASPAELATVPELHLRNNAGSSDFDQWVTLTGSISDDEFTVDIPEYTSFFVCCLFGMGMICGLIFAYISGWGEV
jgi:hypothetical protein